MLFREQQVVVDWLLYRQLAERDKEERKFGARGRKDLKCQNTEFG